MKEPDTAAAQVADRRTLPPGRHGIAPELVADHQRRRLLAAAASAFAEQGYASLSVTGIVDHAQVSRATFYELFVDKADCLLAAHQDAFERLDRVLVQACDQQSAWVDRVADATAAALELAVESTPEATLLTLAPLAGEPRLAESSLAANARLVGRLQAGRRQSPNAEDLGHSCELALLMGVIHVVGAELLAGNAERLPELAPELAQILLVPHLGAGSAGRVSAAL